MTAAYPRRSTLAAYQTVATHGGVAASDPHRLILMLMDGALDRIAHARGCMQHKMDNQRNQLLHAAGAIIEELRASLDVEAGGAIAANLDDLYDYIGRQLIKANLQNRIETLDEVVHLLNEIRGAWNALPQEARALRPAGAPLGAVRPPVRG